MAEYDLNFFEAWNELNKHKLNEDENINKYPSIKTFRGYKLIDGKRELITENDINILTREKYKTLYDILDLDKLRQELLADENGNITNDKYMKFFKSIEDLLNTPISTNTKSIDGKRTYVYWPRLHFKYNNTEITADAATIKRFCYEKNCSVDEYFRNNFKQEIEYLKDTVHYKDISDKMFKDEKKRSGVNWALLEELNKENKSTEYRSITDETDFKYVRLWSKLKLYWKCNNNKHEDYVGTVVRKTTRVSRCLVCGAKSTGKSAIETAIYLVCKKIFDKDAEQSNRAILDGKELDIYLPSKAAAIEFDGLDYHIDRGSIDSLKDAECKKKKINLFRIRSTKLLNNDDCSYVPYIPKENIIEVANEALSTKNLIDIIKKLRDRLDNTITDNQIEEIVNIKLLNKAKEFKNLPKYICISARTRSNDLNYSQQFSALTTVHNLLRKWDDDRRHTRIESITITTKTETNKIDCKEKNNTEIARLSKRHILEKMNELQVINLEEFNTFEDIKNISDKITVIKKTDWCEYLWYIIRVN